MVGSDGRERTAWSQCVGGLVNAKRRIDPVECRGGEDGVEALSWQRPGFERRYLDVDVFEAGKLAASDRGQARSQLHTHDFAPAFRQRNCCQAGAAADLEDATVRADAAQFREIVKQRGGVAGPRAIIAFGVLVEPLAERCGIRFRKGHSTVQVVTRA